MIIGGGIIGCTTAYFLTRHPSYNPTFHKITVLEATSIASGASGKAGGLLALWAYPSSIVPLSYKLHAELAAEHDGAKRWGYRALHCGSLSASGKAPQDVEKGKIESKGERWQNLPKLEREKEWYNVKGRKLKVPQDLDWFDQDAIMGYSEMGTPTTTAQVHPYLFTTSMAELAIASGAEVILGKVTAIDYVDRVRGVTYEDKATKHVHTLKATDIVVAAGPWTSHVFPEAPIEAQRAHSVVVKADVSPYAIFSEIDLPKEFGRKDERNVTRRRHGLTVSPELYARPDGTVYACGEADTTTPLPKTSDLVVCDDGRCQDILDYISSISTPLRKGHVLAKQACYLPSVVGGGGPLIGKTGMKGLLLATGHTCWGIQNSCATGKLISEFIFDGGAKSAIIEDLDPKKFL